VLDSGTIIRTVKLLEQAAPQATVMVSGSYARGTATGKSDLDLLVVVPGPVARRIEAARLRAVLRPLEITADILVVTEQTFQHWLRTPGMITIEPGRPYACVRFGVGIWRTFGRPI
jgi:predicted nucleotidyltransferase